MSRPNIGDRFPIGAVGDAQKEHVLEGKTFSSEVEGVNVEGTMPDRGAMIITPGTSNKAIPAGFHNGAGYVKGDSNLVSKNIVKGISIFGVNGSAKRAVTGSFDLKGETKSITIGFKARCVFCYCYRNEYDYWAIGFLDQDGNFHAHSKRDYFTITSILDTSFRVRLTHDNRYYGTYWAYEY